MNIVLRVSALIIYTFFLGWTVYNVVFYLVLKKRYKEFTLLMYYIFFVSLFVARICQACYQLTYYNSPSVKNAIIAADGFSICIGLCQVGLIADLIIFMKQILEQSTLTERDTQSDVNLKLQKIEAKTSR